MDALASVSGYEIEIPSYLHEQAFYFLLIELQSYYES